MARTQTPAHRQARSLAMRGKNTGPKSLKHRAAIAASMLHAPKTPEWWAHYHAALHKLEIAALLSATF